MMTDKKVDWWIGIPEDALIQIDPNGSVMFDVEEQVNQLFQQSWRQLTMISRSMYSNSSACSSSTYQGVPLE